MCSATASDRGYLDGAGHAPLWRRLSCGVAGFVMALKSLGNGSYRFAGTIRFLAIQLLLLLAVIAFIDVVAYLATPNSLAWKFHDYRKARDYIGAKRGYPNGYFVSHPERGFDIGVNKQGTHEIPELSYPVWSNALGCFDRQWSNIPEKYVYFAGDSFTWGYAPFEQKFATLFEASSGRPSLKCGVSGSGTRHQFHKFKDVAAAVGRYPERVIVSYFSNDLADDYVFPQTTVIAGWLVSTVYTSAAGDIVRVDEDWIGEQLAVKLAQRPERETCTESLWILLKCYSAATNVLNGLRRALRPGSNPDDAPRAMLDYRGKQIMSLGDLERDYVKDDRIAYDGKIALPNQEAIRAWQAHAKANGYTLSFMFIPPPYSTGERDFYAEVKAFLGGLGIEYLDLGEEFRRLGLGRSQVYWRYDGHFSPSGDRIVADVLVRRWGRER